MGENPIVDFKMSNLKLIKCGQKHGQSESNETYNNTNMGENKIYKGLGQ